ncbi:MAG: hypothetical protein ABSC34_06940 [Acidimicrobiales bacterium]|jgi:hypothetical protein
MKQFVRRLAKDERELRSMARADQLKADLRRAASRASSSPGPQEMDAASVVAARMATSDGPGAGSDLSGARR